MRAVLLAVTLLSVLITQAQAGTDKCDAVDLFYCSTCTENPPLQCYACESGYYLKTDGSGCEACADPNCDVCTATSCTTCKAGHFLKSDNTCGKCSDVSNCNSCHAGTDANIDIAICDACNPRFYLVSATNKCEACGSGCATCTATSCTTCVSPNAAVSGDDPKNCANCDNCKVCATGDSMNPVKCQTCADGYYNNNGKCEPCEVGNCALCSQAKNVCDTCKDSWYLPARSTCLACGANCKKCASDDDCSECQSGYGIKTTDDASCDACSANCLECILAEAGSDGECVTCAADYARDSITNKCVACSGVSNCNSCSSSSGTVTCEGCKSGYKLHEYACYVIPDNCKTTEFNSSYTPKLYCTECNEGYGVNDDDTCSSCEKGCLQCEFDGNDEKCQCFSGDVDTDDNKRGVCSSSPVTPLCKDGYFYNEGDLKCEKCDVENCKHCNVTQECLDCDAAAAMDSDGKCVQCPPNCDQCSDKDRCTKCTDGYLEGTDNKCHVCPSECGTCEIDDSNVVTCKTCQDGQYLDNGACPACTANCQKCTSATDCEPCKSGYGWNSQSKSCDACPSHCSECVENLQLSPGVMYCKTDGCSAGYVRNDGVCGACTSNCKSCSNNKGSMLCDACDDGFYLDGDRECKKCFADCKKCSSGSTCDSCVGVKSLTGDKTACSACSVTTEIVQCAVCTDATRYEPATCLACSNLYVLNDAGTDCIDASSLGDKCTSKLDKHANCTQCDGGTTWADNKCNIKCKVCGSGLISYPDDPNCNPEAGLPGDDGEDCPTQCFNAVKLVNGEVAGASAGCMKNSTAPSNVVTDGSCTSQGGNGTTICARTCHGDLCNKAYYDYRSAGSRQAIQLVVMVTALLAAFF